MVTKLLLLRLVVVVVTITIITTTTISSTTVRGYLYQKLIIFPFIIHSYFQVQLAYASFKSSPYTCQPLSK